jgi:hypothetical protein
MLTRSNIIIATATAAISLFITSLDIDIMASYFHPSPSIQVDPSHSRHPELP